jgi:thymidylate kinase
VEWIAFSGSDGTGKTALVNYSCRLLSKKYKTKKMHSPYFNWVKDMLWISGKGKPFGDPVTDNLIFAAGLRCENYIVRDLEKKYDFLVSQRSWLDNFPYRKIQGFSYNETIKILQSKDFRIPDIVFFLKTSPKTAFNRIKKQAWKDKFETLAFIQKSSKEFEKFILALKNKTIRLNMGKLKIYQLDTDKGLPLVKKEVKAIFKKEGFL